MIEEDVIRHRCGLEDKDVESNSDLVSVIRCKDCGYFNTRNLYCNRPCEAIVARDPWDYCSKAHRRVKG